MCFLDTLQRRHSIGKCYVKETRNPISQLESTDDFYLVIYLVDIKYTIYIYGIAELAFDGVPARECEKQSVSIRLSLLFCSAGGS